MDKIAKDMMAAMVAAAWKAGDHLLAGYDDTSRPIDRGGLFEVGCKYWRNRSGLCREALAGRFDGISWHDEDDAGRHVPQGTWWIIDGLEDAVTPRPWPSRVGSHDRAGR